MQKQNNKKEQEIQEHLDKLSNYYNPRIRREVEIVDTLLALVMIILCLVMLLNYNFFKTTAQKEILLYGWIGLVVISFLLELLPQLFDPGYAIFIALAMGMNLWTSTFFLIVGSVIGSAVGYEIGKRYGLKFIYPLFERKALEKTIKFWDKYGKYIVFVGAIAPLPYFPLIFGALGMKRREFWLWGIIPRIFNFLMFGGLIYFGIELWNWI